MFGGAAMRLGVLTKTILREESSGAYIALVVPLDEVCLLLSRTWYMKLLLPSSKYFIYSINCKIIIESLVLIFSSGVVWGTNP